MKPKELRNLAKKIAALESKLTDPELSSQEKQDIEVEITSLVCRITSFEDMDTLDEMVQEILQNS